MCVIGSVSDNIKGEGRMWKETNYKDNSRHFPNLIKSDKAKLLNKGKEGESKQREGGREGEREAGREEESEEGREGERGGGKLSPLTCSSFKQTPMHAFI